MKYEPYYKDLIGCGSPGEVFGYLINTLKNTISGWDYFVNWAKAHKAVTNVEVHLNLLNVLIGKNNIEAVASDLLTRYPEVIPTIPLLLALREGGCSILKSYRDGGFQYESYSFNATTDVNKVIEFMRGSGLFAQLQSKNIKSLSDYVFGVEVGLDSNARKNRSGTAMESIVDYFVADICKHNPGMEYIPQATAAKIWAAWNKKITVEKSSRTIDFAIRNRDKKVFLIEANFYGGGGSKLKSTAGEYQTDFRRWGADGCQFIWITDGAGWKKTSRPLEDTFNQIDCILNLDMIEKGVLKKILVG